MTRPRRLQRCPAMQTATRVPANEGRAGYLLQLPDDLVEVLTDRVLERLREKPDRRFLSKPALAEHLGVSERRIKTLRERGLPARRVGRDLYFDVDEVARFIEREGRS